MLRRFKKLIKTIVKGAATIKRSKYIFCIQFVFSVREMLKKPCHLLKQKYAGKKPVARGKSPFLYGH
jgi:hypothetical protein